ncbi:MULTISPECIES: tetratricopeptide repeat protein [unclassified Chryseobacterium]|uniref:tetratricopeptide repeat protein n=1 Tax=unclassified Chryseobacterium TaxID=2593645 RepID=UPI0030197FE4
MKKTLLLIVFGFSSLHFTQAQETYKLATKEFNNDHYEKAISLYTQSIEKKEEVAKSYNYRGMAYLYSDKLQEAEKDLETSFQLDSSDYSIYTSIARFCYLTGQMGKALEYYNGSLERKPNNYDLYSERAGVKAILEMFNEAITDANVSVEHLPKDYNSYLNRGYVYLRMGDYDKAINDLTASLKIKKSQKGFGNRGTAYALSKKYDLALVDFDKSLEYNPNDPLVLYQKGEVLLALGKNEKACECYLKSKQFGNTEIDDIIEKAKCK